MKKFPKLRAGLARAAIIPFETAIACLVIIAGAVGFFHLGPADPIDSLLPHWEVLVFYLVYLFSGVGIITGILVDLGTVEAFGLWLLAGSVIARFITYGSLLGYGINFIITGTFDLVFLAAAATRLRHIQKKHVILKITKDSD